MNLIGKTLQHKHLSNITIVPLSITNRGYKVTQIETKGKKVKTKTAFFDNDDVVPSEKSLFKLI